MQRKSRVPNLTNIQSYSDGLDLNRIYQYIDVELNKQQKLPEQHVVEVQSINRSLVKPKGTLMKWQHIGTSWNDAPYEPTPDKSHNGNLESITTSGLEENSKTARTSRDRTSELWDSKTSGF